MRTDAGATPTVSAGAPDHPGSAPRPSRTVPWKVVAVLVLAVALIVLPFGVGNFWLRTLTTTLMFAGLGHAMQLMVGLAGWPALGNVVFFGVGAYTAGLLSLRADVPPPIAIALGGIVAGAVALAAARAMLALRGSYFLMATVALNFAMLELVLVARDITNGAQGLTLQPVVTGSPQTVYLAFYFIFLATLGASSLVIALVRRSRLGHGLLAIKGNEDAALMLGIPAFRYKAVAWGASAALSGVIGGIYAFWIGYIDPESVFDLLISLTVILMVLLGGRLLILGPIIAAFAYEVVDVVAWRELNEARLAALGLALVVVVRFLPGGLPELVDHLARLRRARSPDEVPDAA
jgi:branched-chain amino acid transport system permease protein